MNRDLSFSCLYKGDFSFNLNLFRSKWLFKIGNSCFTVKTDDGRV